MKTRLFPLLLLLALALGAGATRRARGQTLPPPMPGVTLTAAAGLDGQCRENAWIPVRVTVQNDRVSLGTVQIQIATEQDIYRITTDLPPNSRKAFETYVHVSWEMQLKTSLIGGGKILALADTPLSCGNAEDLYIGLWSADVKTAGLIPPSVSAGGGLHRAFLTASAIPSQAIGLETLDVLVVGADSDTRTLNEAQREAIRQWALSGGQVLVFGGGNWTYALGLEDMLPFRPQGSRSVTLPGADAPLTLATGTVQAEARILEGDSETPLLLARPLGYGQVVYTTFDPRAIPVERAWEILAPVWPVRADSAATSPWLSLRGGGGGDDGYNALHILPARNEAILPLLCLVSGAYLLLVGPLNFYLFRRRREWLWGSSLAIAGVFTLITLTAGGFLHGKPLVNQLVVVQSWPESATARVEGLLGIYSPRRGIHTYQANGDPWAYPLERYPGSTDGYPRPVVEHAEGVLRFPDTRTRANSMVHAGIAADPPAPRYAARLGLSIRDAGKDIRLEGSLAWKEDFPLQDAVLVWGEWWVPLDDIQPGSEVPLRLVTAAARRSDDFLYRVLKGRTYSYYGSGASEDRQRYTMLSALLSDRPAPGGNRALVAGWSDAAHGLPLTWKQDNRPLKTVGQTFYLLSLPVEPDGVENSPFTYRQTVVQHTYFYEDTPIAGGRIPLSLPASVSLTGLRVTVDTDPGDPAPALSMWNFRTRHFEAFTLQNGSYLPPDAPQNYFSVQNDYLLSLTSPPAAQGGISVGPVEIEVEYTP